MIKSFKHKGLEEFFYTGKKKGIRPEHADKISRILDRLNAATDIMDMNYPGSYLHKLSGNLKGQFSLRVSGIGGFFLNLWMAMHISSTMTITIDEVIMMRKMLRKPNHPG